MNRTLYEKSESDFTFVKFSHDPASLPKLHWHRSLELIFILSGTYHFYIDNEIITAKQGDILLANSGAMHDLIASSAGCWAYVCKFNLKLLSTMFQEFEPVVCHLSSQQLREAGVAIELERLFHKIFHEMLAKKPYYDVISKSILFEIWGILSRHFSNKTPLPMKDFELFNKFHDGLRFINENYLQDIQLEDLARFLNYSTYYTSKLFSQFTNTNFKNYLNTLRVNKALELLTNTDLSISEIATQCGFNTIKSFNNNFRKILNKTPREIRKL